ncbi:MAG: cupin domain-containing protein [Ruminiclostridium sp.]|nr:cupin domain-containing protein [Ruminiclostridium sp.]
MDYLKNLPIVCPEKLENLIDIHPGRVVSMALSREENCQMTVLAFGEGEGVSEEEYYGDTLYYVLDGEMSLTLSGQVHVLCAGYCMAVPANVRHAIGGTKAFKLLQITLQ